MCTLGKKVTYDVYVMAHCKLTSKTIRTIDIDRLRMIRRVNGSTNSRARLT